MGECEGRGLDFSGVRDALIEVNELVHVLRTRARLSTEVLEHCVLATCAELAAVAEQRRSGRNAFA